jgi:hypothetical protein
LVDGCAAVLPALLCCSLLKTKLTFEPAEPVQFSSMAGELMWRFNLLADCLKGMCVHMSQLPASLCTAFVLLVREVTTCSV